MSTPFEIEDQMSALREASSTTHYVELCGRLVTACCPPSPSAAAQIELAYIAAVLADRPDAPSWARRRALTAAHAAVWGVWRTYPGRRPAMVAVVHRDR